MNMQQMVQQAQRIQRELQKAMKQLEEKEFEISKAGMVTVKMYGSNKIISVVVDEDAFEKENKEMIEDMIAAAINELMDQIAAEKEAIEEKITGQKGGFGF